MKTGSSGNRVGGKWPMRGRESLGLMPFSVLERVRKVACFRLGKQRKWRAVRGTGVSGAGIAGEWNSPAESDKVV